MKQGMTTAFPRPSRCGANCATLDCVKLFIFIGVNLGGYVGWVLGERFGTMTAFVLSGLGSMLGVFVGWWAARRYLA